MKIFFSSTILPRNIAKLEITQVTASTATNFLEALSVLFSYFTLPSRQLHVQS